MSTSHPRALLLVLVVALTAGCASATGEPTPARGSGASSASTSPVPSPVVASSPAPRPTSPSAPVSPSYQRTATPATTSGRLSAAALPKADALGPRWTSRVDPGNAEDGYTGNGTAVTARDPRDVVDALLPIGCADPAVYAVPLPVPRHALEGDYAYPPTGAHAIGLVLDYGDPAVAARFVHDYTAALRRCTAGPGGSMTVTVERTPGVGLFASRQVDAAAGETWRELVAPDGALVRLLAVEGAATPVRPWSSIAARLSAR